MSEQLSPEAAYNLGHWHGRNYAVTGYRSKGLSQHESDELRTEWERGYAAGESDGTAWMRQLHGDVAEPGT